jgi:hypothetical protein
VGKALGKSFLGRIGSNFDDKIHNGYWNKCFEEGRWMGQLQDPSY